MLHGGFHLGRVVPFRWPLASCLSSLSYSLSALSHSVTISWSYSSYSQMALFHSVTTSLQTCHLLSSFSGSDFRPIQTANKPPKSYFQTSTGINSFPKIYIMSTTAQLILVFPLYLFVCRLFAENVRLCPYVFCTFFVLFLL